MYVNTIVKEKQRADVRRVAEDQIENCSKDSLGKIEN